MSPGPGPAEALGLVQSVLAAGDAGEAAWF